jgi:protoheme IX farnesyltransferase
MLKTYYYLTKPGIIYGNLLTATAGFLLGARGDIDAALLLAILAGTSLIIGASCVINNVIDLGIDRRMARTQKRALVTGKVSKTRAVIYGVLLGILGFYILAAYTNTITVMVGVVGVFFYLVMYSIFKRASVHGTLVGAVAGAIPPVAGYTATTNQLDTAALLLFLMLVFWQMAHFYAIAIYRMKEYGGASIPVLPLKKGIPSTKVQMLVYVHLFILTAVLLTVLDYTGYVYAAVVLVTGFMWLRLVLTGLRTAKNELWARAMFRYSLIVLLSVCFAIGFDTLLP